MTRHAPIEGSDLNTIEPVNGVFHVAGIIRSPHQLIRINWTVDAASGSTTCQAWQGQGEIDSLARAGYRIESITMEA